MGPEVAAYLDYSLEMLGIQRHRFLRELFALSQQLPREVFIQAVGRARRYRVLHLESLRRIAWFCMSQEHQQDQCPSDVDVDESYRQRPAYQEGYLTDEPDLSIYDDLSEDEDNKSNEESEDDNG